jgi:hypothetical protein
MPFSPVHHRINLRAAAAGTDQPFAPIGHGRPGAVRLVGALMQFRRLAAAGRNFAKGK